MLDNDQAHGFLQRQEILLSELLVGAQAIWKKAQLIGVTDPKWQCYFENLWSNQPNTCEYPNPALFKSKKSSYLLVHLQFMLAEFSLPVTATHFPTVWVWFRFVDSLVGRYTNKSPLKSWSHLVTQNMLLKSPLWLKSTSKPHHFTLHHVKMDGFYIFCSACWILFLVETTPSKMMNKQFFFGQNISVPRCFSCPHRRAEDNAALSTSRATVHTSCATSSIPPPGVIHSGISQGDSDTGAGYTWDVILYISLVYTSMYRHIYM